MVAEKATDGRAFVPQGDIGTSLRGAFAQG